MHGAELLKSLALQMIVKNRRTIVGTEQWRECAKKMPHLMVDIAEALAKR